MRKTPTCPVPGPFPDPGIGCLRQHPSTGGRQCRLRQRPLGEHTPNRSQRRRPGGLFLRHRQHGRGGPTAGFTSSLPISTPSPRQSLTQRRTWTIPTPTAAPKWKGATPTPGPPWQARPWTSQVTIPSSWAIPSGMGRPPSSSPPSWKPMTAPAKPSSLLHLRQQPHWLQCGSPPSPGPRGPLAGRAAVCR